MRSDRHRPRLGKRSAPLGAMIAIVAAAAVATLAASAHRERNSRPADLMLVYVGADDCAPCRAWRNGDGAAFRSSGEFARLTYREVRSPHLQDVLKDENWPEEIRGYRNNIKPGDGVPLWLIVANHEVIAQQFGITAWQERILPKVRSYLR